jgi:inhibitor of cysteine peptidase
MSGMTLRLSETDNGAAKRARLAEEVVLELQESPSTGYRWAIETTGDAVTEIESTFIPLSDAGIGGGGQRLVRFVAAHPGSAEIRAVLRRAWEPPGRNLNYCAITITVEGDSDADDH